MDWISFGLALYGAGVSSFLAYLAWHRDQQGIRFFVTYSRRHDWYGVRISVVNVGFRPVIIRQVWFERASGVGYLNTLDETLGLPKRLDEGEQMVLEFHAEDIEPDTIAFVTEDTHRRQRRLDFAEPARLVRGMMDFTEDVDPRLFAEGRERPASVMRRLSADDPKPRRDHPA